MRSGDARFEPAPDAEHGSMLPEVDRIRFEGRGELFQLEVVDWGALVAQPSENEVPLIGAMTEERLQPGKSDSQCCNP